MAGRLDGRVVIVTDGGNCLHGLIQTLHPLVNKRTPMSNPKVELHIKDHGRPDARASSGHPRLQGFHREVLCQTLWRET